MPHDITKLFYNLQCIVASNTWLTPTEVVQLKIIKLINEYVSTTAILLLPRYKVNFTFDVHVPPPTSFFVQITTRQS